jgi:RimJ/RimL family protein N-acetyltransferase
MRPEDAPSYARWYNDPDIYGHLRNMSQVITLEEERRWMQQSAADFSHRIFSVFYLPEDKLIGNAGFKHLNPEHGTAEIWLVLGEKSYWGQGLGSEAWWLLCRYGFEVLGLQNILGEHYGNNPASLALAKKVGARQLGTRRRSKFINGKFLDVFYTDLLPNELRKPLFQGERKSV